MIQYVNNWIPSSYDDDYDDFAIDIVVTQEVAVNTLTMFKIGLAGWGLRDMIIPFMMLMMMDDYVELFETMMMRKMTMIARVLIEWIEKLFFVTVEL